MTMGQRTSHVALLLALMLSLLACQSSHAPELEESSPNAPPVESTPTEVAAPPPPVAPVGASAQIENERNTIDVFRTMAPSVVFVKQNQQVRDRFSMRALELQAGSGTGFIWDKEGHIVTNYHVVAGGDSFTVTLFNQKTYEARLIGGEPRKDTAVLKIEAPAEELEPIVLPARGYTPEVGAKTIAIGNPFGLDHTLTTGVVSALGREVMGFGQVTIRDMIQTDASINPGNSGGPLLNSAGQIMGMNTMIFSKTGSSVGIGFAVPVSVIRRIVPQIIRTGKAEQVGIGVSILPDDVARRYGVQGVIISELLPGSPAEQAGFQGLKMGRRGATLGDVIVGIDDDAVTNYDELYNALDGRKAGERVTVTVLRDGGQKKLQVELYSM